MARLVVLSTPALADGFRLAGAATIEAHPGPGAAALVRRLAADPATGLLLVTDDLWAKVDERTRGDLERLARPIVLALPTGRGEDGGSRRQLLGEMLQRAIGSRIELGRGGPT